MTASTGVTPPFTMDRPLILGSGSASRRNILNTAGITYEVCKADIDEKAIGDRSVGTIENASHLVLSVAKAKAVKILEILPSHLKSGLLLTADQVIVCNGRILEKPANADEARAYISSYGNSPCHTVGSLVLTDVPAGKQIDRVDTTTIHFDAISPATCEALIDEGEVMFCAGALMIEHKLVEPFIRQIEGDYNAVMGLSVETLTSMVHEMR